MRAPYGLNILDNCLTCPVREEHLFCNLSIHAGQRLNEIKSTAVYPKGAMLFIEGQQPRGVFVLCAGKAKLSTSSREGKTIITKLSEAGDVLGLNSVISNRPYEVTAEMMEPGQANFIPRESLLQFLKEHVQYDELDDKFPSVVEYSKAIGLEYIICPWIPEDLRKSPDIWKQAAEKFNKAGEMSKKAGMQFGYHNHWFEFLPTDGKLPYDELLKLCDANLVKMEMDLCWIETTGTDPVKYFEKYPGRFPLVHVKDVKTMPKISTGGSQNFGDTVDLTEVGSGTIDWKRIFHYADKAGIKHYVVEHDHPKQPIESIKASYEYLSKLTWS